MLPYRCEKGPHPPDECRYKDSVCHKCHKVGHISPVCRSHTHTLSKACGKAQAATKRPNTQRGNTKWIHNIEKHEKDDDDDFVIGTLHALDKSTESIWVEPEVEPLNMELDTGSTYSILPYASYKERFREIPMKDTTVRMKTYTGQKLVPVGVMNVNVSYGSQTQKLDWYIVPEGKQILFGCECLHNIQLGCAEILWTFRQIQNVTNC